MNQRERARAWPPRLLILPPVALGFGVLVWQLQSGARPEQDPVQEVTHTVRAIEAAPVAFVPRAEGYGTAKPQRTWQAVAEVSGKIVEKHPQLERGRLLGAGTAILRIDPADYELALARRQASLDSAEAELAQLELTEANTRASLEIERRALQLAEADLAREQALLGRGAIAQSAVDRTETELLNRRLRVQELDNRLRVLPAERRVLEASIRLTRSELEEARLNLERTTLRMPFDGRVAEVRVEPTEFVALGQVLVVADGIDAAEVEAQFPIGQLLPLLRTELDLSALTAAELATVPERFGLEASVSLRTERVAASWAARFDRVSDRIDPQTRTIGVIVTVDQPYRQAIPGKRPPLAKDMFVAVELRGQTWPDALVVPRVAVHRAPDGGAVLYLVDAAGRLEVRPVTLGPVQGDLTVIADGLAAGERVVTSDLIPAIVGMKLDAAIDAELAGRLRAHAEGGAERLTP